MYKVDDFFKVGFSCDNVIFGFGEGELKILLISRGKAPYQNMWALPGNMVHPEEDLKAAAARVLKELTGLENVFLEQVKTFGKVGRHSAGRVITVAYHSLVKISDFQLNPASFATEAVWFPISQIPDLAYDHKDILAVCFERLKQNIRTRPVGFELLPEKFTLTELQHLYEAILETSLDKRNFRKKILSMQLLIDLNELQENVAHRPAKLYSFDRQQYEEFIAEGFNFEVKEKKKKPLVSIINRENGKH